MDPKKHFIDERFRGVCSYCGALATSRDHVPSKILLDEPYPKNLPVADSCTKCNLEFSASEQYLACLLECVKNGTTKPDTSFREKISKTLITRPALAKKIDNCKTISNDGSIIWQPEFDRIREVILKLARGHLAFELGIQRLDDPVLLEITPITDLTEEKRELFFSIKPSNLFPEIGSRSFCNSIQKKPTAFEDWSVVQESTYRYSVGQSPGDWVKIFLHDYLACHVLWD